MKRLETALPEIRLHGVAGSRNDAGSPERRLNWREPSSVQVSISLMLGKRTCLESGGIRHAIHMQDCFGLGTFDAKGRRWNR